MTTLTLLCGGSALVMNVLLPSLPDSDAYPLLQLMLSTSVGWHIGNL
ncbi:MAG: hypothetical protein GDA36_01365 [Rhodobacteraceae bacterium]|nr:hypothetical protein [Paracoccaceae bacterium]